MNNIQQTRIQLEKTYVSMGGNSLESDAAQPLNELQSHLNVVLDELAHIFAVSFNRRVDVSIVAMGKLLYEVKGGGQGQAVSKSEITAAADAILQPLMDLLDGKFLLFWRFSAVFCVQLISQLFVMVYNGSYNASWSFLFICVKDGLNPFSQLVVFEGFLLKFLWARSLWFSIAGSLSMYATICDKSVLKRLLKELWKIVIRSLEKNIVLPPVTDRSVSMKDSFESLDPKSQLFLALNIPLVISFLHILSQFRSITKKTRLLSSWLFWFQAAIKSIVIDSKSLLDKPKKVEDVTGFFKGKFSGKSDVKNVLNAVTVSYKIDSKHKNLHFLCIFSQDISIEGGQRSLTPKQCAVMEQALEVIKQYFHAGKVFTFFYFVRWKITAQYPPLWYPPNFFLVYFCAGWWLLEYVQRGLGGPCTPTKLFLVPYKMHFLFLEK